MNQREVRIGYGQAVYVDTECFGRILNNDLNDDEELREDTPVDLENGYQYKGLAVAGTSPSASEWCVVRTSFDANGYRSRIQYREFVAWDDRATGWT